ncbi:ABC transporter permease subunit [Jonesiaceae bacterium BS-20]|uniref:ABC transporter permease subunit n=1 Tax=Jonesiaceae bacterium BS-20 TaxID=3120821 RepID=A0AAU7DV37_9MICO
MTANLLSEYRKFFSTRMWWLLLIIMVLYMGLTAAALAFTFSPGVSGEMGMPSGSAVSTVYTTAASFGYIFPALIGVLSITGEYRHKTITNTLLGTPQRGKMLVAKMIAGIPMGLMYGVAGTLGCVGLGAIALNANGVDPLLGQASTWAIIGRSVLAITLWLLVGVGIGALIPNQVAAIVTLLVFTQFIEPIARMALPMASWGENIAKFLPGSVGDAIAGGSFYSMMGTELLPLWAGAILLTSYAVIFAVIGRYTTLRKDIS